MQRKVVYGKTGEEADIWFFKEAIENSLAAEKQAEEEIRRLWKEIYQRRKKIEKQLKALLKKGEENRELYERKIKEIRKKMADKKTGQTRR